MAKASRRHEVYRQLFTADDILAVQFDHIGRSVVKFSVQYIAHIRDEWQPIVRYDSAHGFAHMDISHPDGTQETREVKAKNHREALLMAIADIKERWEFYRQRYERWMK